MGGNLVCCSMRRNSADRYAYVKILFIIIIICNFIIIMETTSATAATAASPARLVLERFHLEGYFAKHEFVAQYLLCCSGGCHFISSNRITS